jgi:RNA polymerase sigma factor (TIGR02999 family)
VPTDVQTRVTVLMDAAAAGGDGGRLATERLFPLVYDELRRMAAALMVGERAPHTLQPTALVNEAYLRLVGPRDVSWQSRAHFFGAAALAMRRILIDRARHVRATRPRAGPIENESLLPTLDSKVPQERAAEDLLALDSALESLLDRDVRQHDVVMLRFFAGLTLEQTAEALGLSPSTVKNEWAWARAWLMREIEQRRKQ